MSRRAALVALACALTGLAASAAATYTHYHLIHDPAYHSFCDVSETISCTQVYASRFSTVGGVPVAIFGAIAFAAAALLAIAGLTAREAVRDAIPSYLFDAQYASTISLVKGDVALGRTLALRGTPTFFINGVRIDSVLAPQYFDEAIAYELQRAGTR